MKTFHGYTPKQTQEWINEAPEHPPKEFRTTEETHKVHSPQSENDIIFLKRAIKLGAHNPMQALKKEPVDGGFFGAVIVKDGKILGEGWNSVLKEQDPSRHAEMNAIRQATHDNGYGLQDLAGATLYTSGAPCPMCYAAMLWANIKNIVYASDYEDAMKYGGFRDEPISASFTLPLEKRELPAYQSESDLAREWWKLYNKEVYKNGKGPTY